MNHPTNEDLSVGTPEKPLRTREQQDLLTLFAPYAWVGFSVVQMVAVVMKLEGSLRVSWWVVLFPTWFLLAVVVVLYLAFAAGMAAIGLSLQRRRAAAARVAHNHEVAGASPAGATRLTSATRAYHTKGPSRSR